MALSIKDDETDALVRQLAALKRVSFTQAIKMAVQSQLREAQERKDLDWSERMARVREIQERFAQGPKIDMREADDWLYDENGLPH